MNFLIAFLNALKYTTPISLLIIVMSIIFQNIYPNIFNDEKEDKKEKLTIVINPEDKKSNLLSIIAIITIVIVPIINFLLALSISITTIYRTIKYNNNNKD